MRTTPLLLTLLCACATSQVTKDEGVDTDGDGIVDSVDDTDGASDTDTMPTGTPCEYPAGAVEPMALGEVLSPYSWPVALQADGTQAPLDLGFVPCAGSDDIDWSPFDVLLFVSIPAW